ncbi:MAG TPA: hypothetical protein VGQ36_09220 [Thermoanaerobaculia bacterium]|jgi:hypothetical protein|nr:hypothetical protein [Thermoanaerobaculia bacterium]
MKRPFLIPALALLLAACATTPKTTEQAGRPWHAVPLEDVRITAERTTDDRQGQHVVIYGDGVAVWNNKIQFRVDADTIKQMLGSFDAAAFETIPTASPKGKFLRRRAAIRAGAYEREAWESWEYELTRNDERETIRRSNERKGIEDKELEKEPALTTLVDSIIDTVVPIVEKGGTTAESLADGLKKVASGQLAPETLSVTMIVKPEPGRGEDSGGFLFRIDGATAIWSDFQGEQRGFADARKVKLSASRMRDLATRLSSFDPESMPINLYSPKYEEVTISVMNREKNIVARQFAGLTPAKHGEAQTRFDAMMSWLSSIGGELFAGTRR